MKMIEASNITPRWRIALVAFAICLSLAAVVSLAGCSQEAASESAATSQGSSSSQSAQASKTQDEATAKRVATDGADIQTSDPNMATRIPPANGTKVNIRFGDEAVLTGVLNDSETAQALIAQLPYTVHMSHYSHDFCGVTEDLPYQEDEVHYGWLNGDIDYAIDAPYFTILYKDQDISEQYGYQVNIGVLTSPLSEIANLGSSYDVTVELAE